MKSPLRPLSVPELCEAVAGADRLSLQGRDTRRCFRVPTESDEQLDVSGLRGIAEYHPDDQLVVVWAGTPLCELNAELALRGQCIPLGVWDGCPQELDPAQGTVGGALSMNLPHALEAECGTWRDWVLGLSIVTAEGTVAKSGSRVVKSVAGYDVHKLFIGARGTLGVVAQVNLRTYPRKSLPKPHVRLLGNPTDGLAGWWIQRTRPSDFARAEEAARGYGGFSFPATATLICRMPQGKALPRFEGDWVLRGGCGVDNLEVPAEPILSLMRRAKALFDPLAKLNRGEMRF